jgi:hypothetical protein
MRDEWHRGYWYVIAGFGCITVGYLSKDPGMYFSGFYLVYKGVTIDDAIRGAEYAKEKENTDYAMRTLRRHIEVDWGGTRKVS